MSPLGSDCRRLHHVTGHDLETSWTRSDLRRAWETRWKRHNADVAEVDVDLYEFTFDRDTHLLLRLVAPPPGPNKPWECQLADYTRVEGIPLPTKITKVPSSDIKATDCNTYALNVDYDERGFIDPPSLAYGPEGWRRRN